MWGQVEFDGLAPSKIDTRILATALTLSVRVVTDDQAMLELAAMYDVETWTTLELMKSMLDAGHITLEKVRMVVEQWIDEKDLPAKELRKPYKRFSVKARLRVSEPSPLCPGFTISMTFAPEIRNQSHARQRQSTIRRTAGGSAQPDSGYTGAVGG